MAELRLEHSDYVVYVLQREQVNTIKLDKEPEGWTDDDLEIIRNKKYHGILTQFTGGLKFRGDAKDFINDAYDLGGINTNLYLLKYVLRKGESYIIGDTIDYIKFKQQYRGLADYNTMVEKDGALEVNFNSQELEQLLESHQGDDLSIGRTENIDNDALSEMPLNNAIISGRDLEADGWAMAWKPIDAGEQPYNIAFNTITIPTIFGVKGFKRHVEVTSSMYDQGDSLAYQANFFYDDLKESVVTETKLEIYVKFKVKFTIENDSPSIPAQGAAYLISWDFNGDSYIRTPGFPITNLTPIVNAGDWMEVDELVYAAGYGETPNKRAYSIEFEFFNFNNVDPPYAGLFKWTYETALLEDGTPNYRVDVKETSRFDTTGEVYRFAFVNEVATRLMEIITGKKNKFYSRIFGRQILPPSSGSPTQYQDYQYPADGEWGNIGVINGFDVRRFSLDNTLYKHITISMKTLIEGLMGTLNIGVGIEDSEFGQRVRFEALDHFYRRKVVVKLPNQVQNMKRQVDPKMFNSAASFGQAIGGDYEFGLGLDEPNISTEFITPLRKTVNKYDKIGRIRSDETGMEILRRHPEYLDPTEDRRGDQDLFFLDLKRGQDFIYEQLIWQDALVNQPTGIISPDTYHNWRFTPKRSMFRHGWILRAGMEQAVTLEKYLTLGSSKANVNLETEYLDGVAPREQTGIVSEKNATQINKLDSAIILPEILTFIHPVDDDLMDWILDTTEVIVDGEIENVPNWYFKFSFINENEEIETGHLISLKPKKGEFTLYKANEKINAVSTVIPEPPITPDWETVLQVPNKGWVIFTISGTGQIDWDDGSPLINYNGQFVEVARYYDSTFDGIVKFYGTVETFESLNNNNLSITAHDLALLPDEMTYYRNEGINVSYANINVSPITSPLTTFINKGVNIVIGDIATLPNTITVLEVWGNNVLLGDVADIPNISNMTILEVYGDNQIDTYTAGVVFNPNITKFIIKQDVGYGFSSTEVDNILIDLYNSGMWSGQVYLIWNNSPRTSASDAAFTGLVSQGVDVQTL